MEYDMNFKKAFKNYLKYKPQTQKWYIMNHFFAKGTISQVEAETVYKIRRLASRISELKEDGWKIETELREDMMGQRYARYSLKSSNRS